MVAKSERGYKAVLRSEVLQLAHNLGNRMLLDRLHEYERDNDKNVNVPNKNMVTDKSLSRLREENELSREQLALRERNNPHVQKLLSQQQQLILQANKQIEKLQEKLQLIYIRETPGNDSTTFSEAAETTDKQVDTEKK